MSGKYAESVWRLAAGLVMALATLAVFRDILLAPADAPLTLFGDFSRQFYPWRAYISAALAGGEIPTWNPFSGLGVDIIARLETGVFYPPNLLLGLVAGKNLSYGFFQAWSLFHFALYGFNVFLLLRELKAGMPAALLAGLCALGGLRMVEWAAVPVQINSLAWVPLVLLFLHRALNGGGFASAAAGGVFLSFGFLAGMAQMMLYSLTVLAIAWLAWSWPLLRRGPAGVGRALALGLSILGLGSLMAAVQFLPSADLAARSARTGADLAYAASSAMNLMKLLWIPFNFNVALGALPLGLALAGLFIRRDRLMWGLFLAALWGWLFALNRFTPVLPLMVKYLPGYRLFRFCDMSLSPMVLCLSVMAGLGLDSLLRSGRFPLGRGVLWPLAGAGAVLAGAAVAFTPVSLISLWPWLAVAGLLALALWRPEGFYIKAAAGLLVLACLAVLLLNGNRVRPGVEKFPGPAYFAPNPKVAWLKARQAGGENFRVNLQGNLTGFDPSATDPKVWPHVALAGLFHRIPAVGLAGQLHEVRYRRFLSLTGANPRLFDLMNAPYEIAPHRQQTGRPWPGRNQEFKYRRFDLLPGGEQGLVVQNLWDKPVQEITVVSKLANALNIKQGETVATFGMKTDDTRVYSFPMRAGRETAEWALDKPGLKAAHNRQQATVHHSWRLKEGFQGHLYRAVWRLPAPSRLASLHFVHHLAGGVLGVEDILLDGVSLFKLGARWSWAAPGIHKNHWALPKAFAVYRARQVAGEPQARQALKNLEPLDLVILEQAPPPPATGSPLAGKPGVSVQRPSAHQLLLKAELPREAWVVISEAYSPWWRARSENGPVRVLRGDYYFLAMRLGPGRHVITITYRNPWFLAGGAISLAGLLLAGLLLWLGRKRF